ncbi:MAG TPA: TIR domain-containing protein [Thermoanaerobaculia bacterium]|nr:TIR domain-containing protein [Thermoanaerobaculia bacterium]
MVIGGDRDSSGRGSERHALFLSYHSAERPTVVQISRLLAARGISTFLDQDQAAGRPWPEALEQALTEAQAVAVFLGAGGFGAWQRREMWFALDRQANAQQGGGTFPVIPVLLPGAVLGPGLLLLNTWVDLRRDPLDPEGLERLARAVEGTAPEASAEALSALCPYRGLQPFGEEEAAFFCGREDLSERLLDAVLKASTVAVLGSSGSGKSSVVHAGLLPRLRRQRPPAPAWDAVSFTPGERPYHRLAAALLPLLEPERTEVQRLQEVADLGDALASGRVRLADAVGRVLEKSAGTGRLLVVVDQLEELFTETEEAARRPFAEHLLALPEKAPVTLILLLRADFYDRALSLSAALSDRLETSLVNLRPMPRGELHRAICGPAERVGLEFEPGLVDRILADVGEEPGNLPLLEFALTELWARRSGRQLTNQAYTESGGVAQAIARRAEVELERLTAGERQAARRVFTGLVRLARAEEGSRDTRRRTRLADLDPVARQVTIKLAGPETRLLVTGKNEKDEGVVEVVHEALIQSWERLRRWLDEDREFLLWRERLRTYLTEHERNGALLSGAPLAEAQRWLGERKQDLSGKEVDLVGSSIRARDRVSAAEVRRQHQFILAGIAIAVLLATLVVIAGWQEWRSRQETEETRASLILAKQDTIHDPTVLALLATEIDKLPALRFRRSLEATRFARRAAMEALPVAVLRDGKSPVKGAIFSPDNSRILTFSADGNILVWRADGTGEPMDLGYAERAAFSPDGTRILSANNTGIRIWRTDGSGEPVPFRGQEGALRSTSFSPDGSHVATVAEDRIIRIWRSDGSGGPAIFGNRTDSLLRLALSSDGSRMLTLWLDHGAQVWKSDGTGQPVVLRHSEDSAGSAQLSPDGSHVLIGSPDGVVRVWRSDGSGNSMVLLGNLGSFSHDSSRVAIAAKDGTVRIWQSDGFGEPVVLHGHEGEVGSVSFSPDGSRIVTASFDHTARVWGSDAYGAPIILRHEREVLSAGFNHDGSQVVTVSGDGSARVWGVASLLGDPVVLFRYQGDVLNMTLSPDGSRVAVIPVEATVELTKEVKKSDTVRVYGVGDSAPPAVLRGHKDDVLSAVFSPDGSRIATVSRDRTSRVWRTDGSGSRLVLTGNNGPVESAAFSPDGSSIMISSKSGAALIGATDGSSQPVIMAGARSLCVAYRLDNSRTLTVSYEGVLARVCPSDLENPSGPEKTQSDAQSAAFSPEGKRVAVGYVDGTIRIWQADGAEEPILLRGHQDKVTSVAFSTDGSRIVSASEDATARVWNADGSGEPLILDVHEAPVKSAVFSPDGSRVLTASVDGTVRSWRVTWEALMKEVRRSIKTCFTPEQRVQYLAEATSTARLSYETCERGRRHPPPLVAPRR